MMKTIVNFLLIAFTTISIFTGCASEHVAIYNTPEWEAADKRGQEILRKLASLTPKEIEEFDVASFRDETVVFYGWPANGGCNDVETGVTSGPSSLSGFYIRVLNESGRDLRPRHVAGWEVYIRGKIIQVLPKNRVIVLEIKDSDYCIGCTT